MNKFRQSSLTKLSTIHPLLQDLLKEVIQHVDFTIIEGVRSVERQQELLRLGRTKILKSKHLLHSTGFAHAVDIMPSPVDWADFKRNYYFIGFVRGIAKQMGIDIRVGADWNGDFNPNNQSFHDIPHIELILV